jgi:hypothetical protein
MTYDLIKTIIPESHNLFGVLTWVGRITLS